MDENYVTYSRKEKLQARLWQLLIYTSDLIDAAVGIITLTGYNPWLAMRLRCWVMKNEIRKRRQRRADKKIKYAEPQ